MSKIDIVDGFYRVLLRIEEIPKLGVALPVAPGQVPLVAFPSAVPMGWVESLPYLTTLTETVCDLSNAKLADRLYINEPHRLKGTAATTAHDVPRVPPPRAADAARSIQRRTPQAASVDIYVDDFLLLAQTKTQQDRVLRTALNTIDEVFRPLKPGDPSHRKEPSSVKKMLKGNASWSTCKRLLVGWDVDSIEMTLNLPPHRLK